MSPRAAWRLDALGFTQVYDYTAGEADWFAYGLPMDGANATVPRIGELVRRDIPRCNVREGIGGVRQRVEAAGWDRCVVVNDTSVVLGLLRTVELSGDPNAIVEAVMRSGPATYRPDTTVTDAVQQLTNRKVAGVLVTRVDGTLLGWLRRDDAERLTANDTQVV